MEKVFRKALIIFATLGLVGFLANLLIDNPYTHSVIRAGINEKVKELTYLTVDFKAVKVSLVPLGVDLYGFSLAPAATPNQSLTRASHVGVRVSIFSLILGEPSLSLVEANDLEIIWPPPWGFAGFLREKSPKKDTPSSWPPAGRLPLEQLVLKNAQIFFEAALQEQVPLAPNNLTLTLVGLNVDATLDDWDDIDAAISVQEINGALGSASFLESSAFSTEIQLRRQTITAAELKIDGQRLNLNGELAAHLNVAGRQRLLTGINIKTTAKVAGDLSILGSFLDISDTRGLVTGDVQVSAFIPVASEDPGYFKVEGRGKAHGTILYGYKLFDSETAFAITKDKMAFSDMNVMIGESSYAKGHGEILFNDTVDFDFNANTDHLPLASLLDALTVDFDVFDAAITSPDLKIAGQASPFTMRVNATGHFTDISLPTIAYDHSRFPVSPACKLAVHLGINSQRLDFAGTQGQCYQPALKTSEARIEPKQVSPPANHRGAAPVSLRGQIFFDDRSGLDILAQSPEFNLTLAEYFAQTALSGSGRLDTRIHGPYDHILVDVETALTATTVQAIPLGDLTATLTVDDRLISWRDTSIRSSDGGGQITTAAGSLTVNDALYFETKLIGTNLSADLVNKIASAFTKDDRLSFEVNRMDAALKGPLLFPLAWQGTMQLSATQIKFDHELLADQLDTTLLSDKSGWSSRAFLAALGDLRLSAQFKHKRAMPFNYQSTAMPTKSWTSLGLHPDDTFKLELESFDNNAAAAAKKPLVGPQRPNAPPPDHLQRLPFAGSYLQKADITGLVTATGTFEGKTDHIAGAFKGRINRPNIFGSGFSPINFKGFVDNGKIDMMFDHSGNALAGRLSMDLMAEGIPYEWFFNVNRLDLRAFGTKIFYADARNYAYLTADWQMRGQFADWWRSTGELNIKDVRANYVRDLAGTTKGLQITQEQPVKLLFSQDNWRFAEDKDLLLTGNHVRLRLSVTGTRPPDAIDLKLESLVDMAILQDFIGGIDTASGKVRIAAEVKGPASDPKLHLAMEDLKQNPFNAANWKPITIGFSDIRPPFRNVQLRSVYENERLTIETFSADKGAGSLTASGSWSMNPDNKQESRLDIDLKDATMIYPIAFLKSFETQISGNVNISGKGVPYRVGGDLSITRARSTQEVDIRDEIINALRRQSFSTTLVSEKPLVELDLNVTADQSINIHNRNLQTLLSGDIQIKGTDIAPVVSGQLEVDKGKFIYKREFQVTRGLVTFDDPVRPDPNIDILAVSEVGNYRVYIAINGRASNPTVELTADPPTSEDGSAISKEELLVLISSGKLPDASRTVGETATSEAVNLIMGQFEEPVEKLFDLTGQNVVRTVYIDTYPSQKENDEGRPVPRLNLPLDLSEDFDVVLRADTSANELSTEYSFHDNITFSSSLKRRSEDSTGTTTEKTTPSIVDDAELDLKFRFSFE